jgi:hypothetical protein
MREEYEAFQAEYAACSAPNDCQLFVVQDIVGEQDTSPFGCLLSARNGAIEDPVFRARVREIVEGTGCDEPDGKCDAHAYDMWLGSDPVADCDLIAGRCVTVDSGEGH